MTQEEGQWMTHQNFLGTILGLGISCDKKTNDMAWVQSHYRLLGSALLLLCSVDFVI